MKRLLALALFLAFAAGAEAASQGPLAPSAASSVTGPGSTTWNSPSYAEADDSLYSTVICTHGTECISQYLKVTGFGFSIPTGSTINGVVVTVKRKASSIDIGVTDDGVFLVKGDAVTGADQSTANAWPTTEATYTFGGTSSLWGTTLSASDVNASNFGFVIAVDDNAAGLGIGTGIASVNFIAVTVYYTAPTPTPTRRWPRSIRRRRG